MSQCSRKNHISYESHLLWGAFSYLIFVHEKLSLLWSTHTFPTCDVYREGVMKERNLPQWCYLFNGEGRVIWMPVCHHEDLKAGVSHPLWYCHSSTPVQRDLCQMGSKIAHRWTQAEEVKETVMDWLNGLVVDFYDMGIVRFAQQTNEKQQTLWPLVRKWTIPTDDCHWSGNFSANFCR
jgi:hypothetical protein